MSSVNKTQEIEDELHALKTRFELLVFDRKAYYETSQWAIRQNKEDIAIMRAKNKVLSENIAKIKKSEAESTHSMSDLDKYDYQIVAMQKKYDEHVSDLKAKEARVVTLQNDLVEITRECEMVYKKSNDSPQSKDIQKLENKLDKAMIKYNEAQAMRKTYENIVKRLQKEKLGFDNQIENFKKTIKARKIEATELELMSKDANHAKEVAKAELMRFEQQINEEKKQRDKDLNYKKELCKQRVEINEKIDQKAVNFETNIDNVGAADHKETFDDKEIKLGEYEEAFRLIKEVSGVCNIKEVVEKFQNQGDTKEHLLQLQSQSEARREEVLKKKLLILKEYNEIKFSGESKYMHSRSLVEEFEQHVAESVKRMNESKQKYERAAQLFNNSQAGIKNLYEKLETIPLPENFTKPTETTPVLTLLEICTLKLDAISKNIQGKETIESTPPSANIGDQHILQVNPNMLPQHNMRIKLNKPSEFDEEAGEDEDEDEEMEVLDREGMKRHTLQLLNTKQKTKQPRRSKKKTI